jgi:hypothetical protein
MKKLKPTYRCECGWDIPVTLLNVPELPDSNVGMSVCSECDRSYFHFTGSEADAEKFHAVMNASNDHPEKVMADRLWMPVGKVGSHEH